MNEKQELKKVFDYYADSDESVVDLPIGLEQSDLKELFEVADFFAERYGLGGCKSLEEFVQMIDHTDPHVINMLKAVAIDKNNKEMDEISKKPKDDGQVPVHGRLGAMPPSRPSAHRGTPVRVKGEAPSMSRSNMKRFLLSFGAPQDGLDKACGRLDSRKIEFRDYGWVDSHTLLSMSPEKFRETLHNITNDIKSSENFEVSDETLRARRKRENKPCLKSK